MNRSGGCILHAPGQLAVYPIVPLRQFAWPEDEAPARFELAASKALEVVGVRAETTSHGGGLWGRTGLLAAVGISVQDGTTCHGLFINVAPAMSIGQFAEIVVMVFLGMMITRWGFRGTMALGALCYVIRYLVFGTTALPACAVRASNSAAATKASSTSKLAKASASAFKTCRPSARISSALLISAL